MLLVLGSKYFIIPNPEFTIPSEACAHNWSPMEFIPLYWSACDLIISPSGFIKPKCISIVSPLKAPATASRQGVPFVQIEA